MTSSQRLVGTADLNLIEAPVTWRAYLICGFASFGGILYGYDSGYISGVLGMDYVKEHFGHPVPKTDENPSGFLIASSRKSLITSILSAGTFIGALLGGAVSENIGRRLTIMLSCLIFAIGVAVQVATVTVGGLVAGRFVAGLGVGGVSATVILYVSEISPRKVRGLLVSAYQWAITIGLLVASGVDQGCKDLDSRSSYRIPIGLQFIWAAILAAGLFLLPESPRYYVRCGRMEDALGSLERVRGQPRTNPAVRAELAEIKANFEYEKQIASTSWADCFKGGLSPRGNLRRVIAGTCLQMFQQWTGINFIFYYGTTFFQSVGIKNAFLISTIMNVVNVVTTPASFWMIEKLGRRILLLYGAAAMCVCEFLVAIIGVTKEGSQAASTCLIVFTCFYIAAFATTWGPAAWVVVGEIYPLPIRAKGIALATASNWFWNCVIAVITPYMVDDNEGNLKVKVFFVWGSALFLCLLFAYFFIPETKGLTLEQVDKMLEESTPATSAKWKPHDTFAHEMGMVDKIEPTVSQEEHTAKNLAGTEHIRAV
ncbi:Major facilitator-type transporter ecdD [Penicillium subrubescens]|uniref:High-affinity glucose transporter SNF3 n=1 Tax=Penicillium subrubescens TaxID=1316194 RepID=A0A1Q5T8B9_9EURO|nr:Major facilitator-type transporter ecdD [Penicillium subrubescens]KAJ5912012.1 Major facilitator-type transporter ecdD [Penicillium subrubescens]OKO96471.1 High-affinity glucose transporter SNF3 [Penicillium subrubescens]